MANELSVAGASHALLGLVLVAVYFGAALAVILTLGRLLKPGDFIDGLHSPDLALQMIGSRGDIAAIVTQHGHLPLLNNLAIDSRVFVPAYVVALGLASTHQIGWPFPCGCSQLSPPAVIALLLAAWAGILDWCENDCLEQALHHNSSACSETVPARRREIEASRQAMLGRGKLAAILKFCTLGLVLAMLAWHAMQPRPPAPLVDWRGSVLFLLFGLASVGMLSTPFTARFLELAVALAGFGVALLALLAWSQ